MVAAGSITVAVRVRPPNAWEAARLPAPCYDTTIRGDGALSTPGKVVNTSTLRDIVQIVDDRILTFDPDEKDKTERLWREATAQPLLKGILDGYNATVFAYGATGCGKTHTISGTEDDPGIIYLTMADLFQRIEDRKDEWNVEVMVTFLEIYNEEIRDLLSDSGTSQPRGGLCIREDKTVKVVGLVELKPNSAEEVKEIVLQGNMRRTQSPTHANETSSRSHAVLQVHVTQSPRTAAVTEQRTMATLSIIDLAGSERAAATMNMGQRMVEGANINKSLLALGNCINALCESGGASRHIPYRNSKLTRLLKFSLGGNCKTVMIVCVAPTSSHFDDTHNTLIKTRVVTRNVVNVDRHVGRYAKAEVERAKNDLKQKVQQTEASIIDGAICSGKLSVAKAKLNAIHARLDQIASEGPSSSVDAERALLQALAGPEEDVIKPGSIISTRLQRSSNSNAMFDATMRAVSERRSEKLDDISVENVKLDAHCKRAEMEKLKVESERNAMKDAVDDMSDVMVKLLGILANILNGSGSGDGDMTTATKQVASLLYVIKEKNNETFKKLVGHSTESYIVDTPTLDPLRSYEVDFTARRISSGPAVLQQSQRTTNRRLSAYSTNLSASPPRRTHRSPRKSLRSSLAQAPYRKVSDKERKNLKTGKNVQWRDEVGQGDLDDGGAKPVPVSLAVIPASPAPADTNVVHPSFTAPSPTPRNSSVAGSESEWEDENDKTDDRRGAISKRQRPSRLDPSFLKSKPRGSTLGSLREDDESVFSDRKSFPLLDMSMNQVSSSNSTSSTESSSGGTLHVPKARDRAQGSPNRRGPSTPSMRADKPRRRSSMIPQLSSPSADGMKAAPRRVLLGSPGKRAKRASLSKSVSGSSIKLKAPGTAVSSANLSVMSNMDPNASADISMNRSLRPTWR
ncbi:P-loop containing nucleoside triphosphate hydrolase protein [Cyathus striatus]|nr:P-loop containing nucleoside triphosphate hydrolase protein [Cyathus striatus]